MIIIKLLLNLVLIVFYLKINHNKYLNQFTTTDFLSIILNIVVIVLSLTNNISIFINIILSLITILFNYSCNYFFEIIKVNYDGKKMLLNNDNSLIEAIKEIRIKRLRTILKRYNL
ncbi:MAG: hypothetical protein PUC23_05025 [bacterium]|nr:hypothetical protein [bacterium]